jgi:hypothetical protein
LWQVRREALIDRVGRETFAAAHRACLAEPAPAAADGPEPETADGPEPETADGPEPETADGPEPETAVLAHAGPPDPKGKFADTARRKHERVPRG